jgi:hypothetical protein
VGAVNDKDVLGQIHDLVAEEHRLRDAGGSDEERARLAAVEQQLDQCWDLLRRRRAARQAHGDPDAQGERPVPEVERYLQ